MTSEKQNAQSVYLSICLIIHKPTCYVQVDEPIRLENKVYAVFIAELILNACKLSVLERLTLC